MNRYFHLFAVLAAFVSLMAAGIVLANSSAQIEDEPIAAVQSVAIDQQPVDTNFSYQGRLKRQGAPYTGSCAFQFELWDAAAGGTQKGSMTLNAVALTEGLFSVELDFGDQFWGDALWLATAVQCPGDNGYTDLGREPLTAVPYALGLRPGTTVQNQNGNALTGISQAESKAGLVGLNLGQAGYGVYGSAVDGSGIFGNSINWIGVYGETDAVGGTGASGVWGRANNSGGIGVVGYAPQPDSIGVKGAANASGGVGVWGESTANTGVYGVSGSGVGIWGTSTNASGVYGVSGGQYSGGVYGLNTTNGYGVYGTSADGIGVVGKSENGTAVFGRSTNGLAGDFKGTVRTEILQITGGSDLAERFAISDAEQAKPGTVMVIDPDNPGHLMPSSGAYDRKVAGVVSGAGDVQPGLTLHQEGVLEGDTVMAIAGRVYVWADASNAAIQPGDLLTTSATPGHAMKVTDHNRAQGAILGKAMTSLEDGQGLVLVLVSLQ